MAELSALSSFFSFQTFGSKTSPNEGGVAFIVFNPKIKISHCIDGQDRHMCSMRISYMERELTLVNFYVPTHKRRQQRMFRRHLGVWDPQIPILFVGDWNFLDNPEQDSIGQTGQPTVTPTAFESLREFYHLTDVMCLKPSKHTITRWNVTHNMGARLDRMYASADMTQWVMSFQNEAIPCQLPTSIRHTISTT